MNQDEILDALEDERERLVDAIEGLSEEQLTEPGVVGDWSVKDVLHHLAMWEAELVKLLWQATQGGQPATVHFGKLEADQINANWQAQGKDRSLALVMGDFTGVRKQTARRVEAFSDQDLNNARRFAWLHGRPLSDWIADDSFKHEAEHVAQILEWRERKGY